MLKIYTLPCFPVMDVWGDVLESDPHSLSNTVRKASALLRIFRSHFQDHKADSPDCLTRVSQPEYSSSEADGEQTDLWKHSEEAPVVPSCSYSSFFVPCSFCLRVTELQEELRQGSGLDFRPFVSFVDCWRDNKPQRCVLLSRVGKNKKTHK